MFNPSTDLVTPNTIMMVAAYGDGTDSTSVTINSWNTGANNYIKIYTPTSTSEVGITQRHSGTWDTAKYYIETGGRVIYVQEGYVRIEGLQISQTSVSQSGDSGILVETGAETSEMYISHNIIRGMNSVTWHTGIEFYTVGPSSVAYVWNNHIYDFQNSTFGQAINPTDPDLTAYIYNNTLFNNGNGINSDAGGVTIGKNNISFSNSGSDYLGMDAASDNNLGQDAAFAGDANYVQTAQSALQMFVDPSGSPRDYHILSTSDAAESGADLSGDSNLPFSDDIDLDTRPQGSQWDIGADEQITAGTELLAKVETFTAIAGTGNQIISTTGFQPKAVLFWITDLTSVGNVANSRFGRGWTDGTNQGAAATAWADGSNTTWGSMLTDSTILLIDEAGASLAKASIVSLNADGFTINWTIGGGSRLVTYLALGGPGLTDVEVGSKTLDALNATEPVTGLGFQPDGVLAFGARDDGLDFGTTQQGHAFGVAVSTTSRHSSSHRERNDGFGFSGYRDNEFLAPADDTSLPEAEWDLQSFDADGFTLVADVSEDVVMSYLALKGANIAEGILTQPTAAGDQSVTSLSFTPSVVMFDGGDKPTTSGFESQPEVVHGVATSPSERSAIWTGRIGTASDTDLSTSAVIRSLTSGTPTLDAEADFVSMNADGFTINWSTPDATQRKIGWVALGPGSITPPSGPLAHWNFDEGTGQTANDVAGNGYDGTLGITAGVDSEDPGWVCVTGGKALSFDGSDDELDVSSVVIGNSAAWTISAWIKVGPDTLDQRAIYGEGDTVAPDYLLLYVDDATSTVRFYSEVNFGTSFAQVIGTANVEDDAWHLVTMVQRSKTDRELFVDGLSDGTSTQNAGTLTMDTASIGVLNYLSGPVDWFKGSMDDVRIYDRALSTGEISTLAASPPTDCGAATEIYYSVGTSLADLKTGSPLISITNGTATFDVPQTGNIGVGDVVDYDTDNKKGYIKSVTSSTEFEIQTSDGNTPTNITDAPVNSINRVFNTIQSAVDNSGGASYLNTFNLVSGNYTLTWVAYNDAPFADGMSLDGYSTDATHYVTLTVAGASQVASGTSQRHTGIEGTGAVVDGLDVAGTGFDILDDYTVVKWLEMTRLGPVSEVVLVDAANVLFTDLIIHDMLDHGLDHTGAGVSFTIRNSLIYSGGSDGISWSSSGGDVTIENSTIYGMGGTGIQENAGIYTVRNTLSMGSSVLDIDVSNGTQDNNMSSDTSAQPVANQSKLAVDQFIDHLGSPPNFHLEATADAIDAGTDLSGSFTNDIDDESRGASWDIGADEYTSAAASVNYRSIGTDTNPIYDVGDASINSGQTTVTFAGGASLPVPTAVGAVGQGDKLVIGGETFFILSRTDATHVEVQTAAASTHSSATYSITRAYSDIQSWEDPCGATPCLPNSSGGRGGDLVGETRVEVGVAYKDGVFSPTAQTLFQDSTTDSNHYMHLTVAVGQRHDGTAGTGVIVDGTSVSTLDLFLIRDPYMRMEWIEIRNFDGDTAIGQPIEVFEGEAEGAFFSHLLIHDYTDQTRGAINIYDDATVRNSIFYNGTNGIRTFGIDNPQVTLENLTIYNMSDDGVRAMAAGTIYIKNIISVGSGGDDFDLNDAGVVIDPSSGYNLYTDVRLGVHPGTNNQSPPASLEDLFVSIVVSSEDLHIEGTGNAAIDNGTSLSGSFTDDIDEDSRPQGSEWDIGADEAVGAGAFAYWNFDEGGAAQTAADSSGNGRDGTLGSTTSVEGSDPSWSCVSSGYALEFDGSDDQVLVGDHDLLNAISISAWINWDAITTSDGIGSKRTGTEVLGNWALRMDDTGSGLLEWMLWTGSGARQVFNSTSAINIDEWTHVVLTFDETTNTANFYINGTLDNTTTSFTNNLEDNAQDIIIGWAGQSSQYFDGHIDDLRLYDYALTQPEVTTLAGSTVTDCAPPASAKLDQIHYRWRDDDGGESGGGSAPTQVSVTGDTTTISATDVAVSGMSITPGAGDYLVWFSGSVENSVTGYQHVSLYLDSSQIAHTEREIRTESSIPATSFPVATHARLIGVTAGQTIEVRWRTTAPTATMHERTLVVQPMTPADTFQATATIDTTTISATDELVSGMTLTPGAGDYLVWFSGSVEGTASNSTQFVSIYQNGSKVNHSEREIHSEGSIAPNSFPVATHAHITSLGASQPIEIRWRTTAPTATMHQRTLVVQKIDSADISEATASTDTTTISATDVLASPLSLTPGVGDYLVWFSGSLENTTNTLANYDQFVSLYVNGVQVGHTERVLTTEDSIGDTSFPFAGHAYVTGVGASDAIEVRWRTTFGTATMHERTLTVQQLSSSATFVAAEDTAISNLAVGVTRRIRFEVSNEGTSGSGEVSYQLQVAETATCSGGSYAAIPTDSSGHWQIVDSSNITDGEATSNIVPGLFDEATAFIAGELKDAGNWTQYITLASDEFTEIEYAVQGTSNSTPGGNYCFRLYNKGAAISLDTYDVYAQASVAP